MNVTLIFRRRTVAAALVVAGALWGAFAPAQDPGFVLQGEGGLVTALVLDPAAPATIYAATARGLFRSASSGANWEPRNRGLENHSVLALAIDPSSPGTLYATTDTG